jgi:hypothetical protein
VDFVLSFIYSKIKIKGLPLNIKYDSKYKVLRNKQLIIFAGHGSRTFCTDRKLQHVSLRPIDADFILESWLAYFICPYVRGWLC